MNLKQIEYIIQKQKGIVVEIKNEKEQFVAELRSDTPEGLISELKEFIEQVPARVYRLAVRSNIKHTMAEANILDYRQEQSSVERPEKVRESINYGEIESSIEKKVTDKLLAEYEHKERIRKLDEREAELNKKHENLESIGGRALYLVEIIGGKLIEKYTPVIQGLMSGQMQTAALAGTGTETGTENPVEEQEKVDKALELLSKHISADQLLLFATTIDAKPYLVPLLMDQLKKL